MSQVDRDAVKNEARRRVHNLVEDYMRVLAAGRKESFNEERVKIAYIVPFLEALQWNPRTDEVLPEQATLTGRADFGLRVGGRTKIFVEMKSFSKSLDGYDTVKGSRRSYAEQSIQYAWGMKADWAVLTNFEEIRLYDSHVKKPEDGLVWKKPIRFTDYESRFDEIWLISKESVVSGALDAYRAKVERPPVDEAFLGDLMNCRQLLAEDINKNNPGLTYDLINESVQKILDRLIFIKNCEDRLIIPAESLWKRFKAWQETAIDKEIVIFMMDLKNLFRYFDQVYNGKLFEKHPCEDLKISNEVLEEIIDTLYGDGEHLGYNFSVIPVDVLGQAYELYIGSIIKEKGGYAKAVEIVKQPAKRKAHGIYYTPEPVVNYIIRGTLGRILEECKTPEDVSRIKVLDPACGSGSFLIKAFDVIRDWYEKYNKLNRPIGIRGTLDAHIVPIPNIEERILTENLYGVDLDPQAVEITILNLSLKAVKTKEKLPYMADHIKCGDSLVDDEKIAGDKAFKWEEEFKEIMKGGGFDVIIGNPPYVNAIQLTKIVGKEVKQYWKNKYYSAKGAYDIFVLFFEQSLNVCKEGGFVSFITPNKYLSSPYGVALRELFSKNYRLNKVLDLSRVKVFDDPSVYPIITILQKTKPDKEYTVITEKAFSENIESKTTYEISSKNLKILPDYNWGIILSGNREIIEKVFEKCEPLEEVAIVQATSTASEADEYAKYINETNDGLPVINTGTIDRYSTTHGITEFRHKGKQLKKPFLDISRINENRKELYKTPKIVISKLALRIEGFLDGKGAYASLNTNCIHSPKKDYSIEYLAGIINSKFMSFIYSELFSGLRMSGGYFQFQAPQLRVLPIARASEEQRNKMSALVNRIVLLNERLNEIGDKITEEKARIEEEKKKTDAEIDELVYKIYGITEAEKKII